MVPLSCPAVFVPYSTPVTCLLEKFWAHRWRTPWAIITTKDSSKPQPLSTLITLIEKVTKIHCRKEKNVCWTRCKLIKRGMWVFLDFIDSNRCDSTSSEALYGPISPARSRSCKAGSCMKYLSPTDGDYRQHQGRSKTGLGIAFTQTIHIIKANTSD